tara:strand:- start:124 stop:1311 length:1188 start_codon:yes stop_codon:yes gene_type:complete
MHLIENFSLCSGLKTHSPLISETFYPIVPKKYITLHTEDHPSKQWDHLQPCINILKPFLDEQGISIIELGYNKVPLDGVISIKNAAGLNQNAYVIKNSLLHMGPEGLFIQLASYYQKPLVALFSNTSPDYCRPLWGDPSKEIFLEAQRNGNKPSYKAEENPKTLNSIFAESVASRILNLLEIPHKLDAYEPLFCGPLSHNPCIEVIPDFDPNPQFYPRTLLNIRLDYHFDENVLAAFANERKLSIITDRPISLPVLRHIKPAIEHIFYKVDPEGDVEYINSLKTHGIPCTLLADSNDTLSETRFRFLEWPVEKIEEHDKKLLDKNIEICDNTYFSSTKSLYSKGVAYPCKLFWEKGIKKEKYNTVIDDPKFWDEIEHYKLYKKQTNGKKRKTTKN